VKLVLLIYAFALPVFAMKTNFTNEETVAPASKSEVEEFVSILKQPGNWTAARIHKGDVKVIDLPREHTAKFAVSGYEYMIYHDDFNNDGIKEYLVSYVGKVPAGKTSIEGVFHVEGKKLVSLNFEDTVVSNLFAEADISRFHPYLAQPFAVHDNGKTYLRFKDEPQAKQVYTYIWKKDKFTGTNL
jgi:hypothetical protein